MSLIHTGIRPKYKIEYKEDGGKYKGFYYELLPNGTTKLWSQRMLRSGCNKEFSLYKEMNGLIYCPYCDEYFSEDQFEGSI